MPNWAKGTLKLRGKKENIVLALKKILTTDADAEIDMTYNDGVLMFTTDNNYFSINGSERAFIENNTIEIWLFEDIETIEIQHFAQAWKVQASDYQSISSDYEVDIKIFAFECGMEFTQEIEIHKGKIVKDVLKEYDDYLWDVPFSELGG